MSLIRFLLNREFALSLGNFLLFCNILSFHESDRRRFVVEFTNGCTASITTSIHKTQPRYSALNVCEECRVPRDLGVMSDYWDARVRDEE